MLKTPYIFSINGKKKRTLLGTLVLAPTERKSDLFFSSDRRFPRPI